MLRIITAPTLEPVTLAELKEHLRIDHRHEDTLLARFLRSARDKAEKITRRQLMSAELRLQLDAFPPADCPIDLPRPPLVSVDSITYLDAAGEEQEIDAEVYTVDTHTEPGRLALAAGQAWPATLDQIATVTIDYTAGATAAADVSETIALAILLLAGHWYQNREAAGTVPEYLHKMLLTERVDLVVTSA